MNDQIVTALCSYGMSGEVFHAPYLSSNESFHLKYILERTKNRSKERYPDTIIARSYEELLKDDEIDLIVVNTPHAIHFPMAKAALLHGKHVVVEKPFAVSVEECKELSELASKMGLMIAVYHNKRLEGDYIYFKKVLESKQFGKLHSLELRYDRWKPALGHKFWKENNLPGAGILYDLGSHLIDFSLSLFGFPNKIESKEFTERPNSPIPDAFEISLTYDDFSVLLGASMMTKEPGPKVKAVFEEASVTINGNDPQEGLLINGVSPSDTRFIRDAVFQNADIVSQRDARKEKVTMGNYQLFYDNVAAHLKEGAPLYVSPKEATDVLRVIQQVRS